MDKTVLEKYTKTYGTRFSRRQKKRFIEALHQDFHALGYEPTMIEGKKLLSHAHNYLYGNMKQMKTVIVVPYDTPERKFWKKVLYFPFDGTKTANQDHGGNLCSDLPVLCADFRRSVWVAAADYFNGTGVTDILWVIPADCHADVLDDARLSQCP